MIELTNEDINTILDSLAYMQERSVTATNSFNNPVYNECAILIEKIKQTL